MAAASHASPTAGSGWARPEASEVRAEHRRLLHTGQMDSFDLGRLSDYDFEVVCKDLFEEILGVRLQSTVASPVTAHSKQSQQGHASYP